MESNVNKQIAPDFSHFVTLTLQNRMPWKMLSLILVNLAPTLDETREIICILLKELEALHSTLQKKDIEVKVHENYDLTAKTQMSNIENQNLSIETETQSPVQDNETIEDEIEVLDVVKESINEEMYLDINESPKAPVQEKEFYVSSNENENDMHMTEENEHDVDKSVNEIDNGWYTFVANDKNCDSGIYLTLENKEIVVELVNDRSRKNQNRPIPIIGQD